jgi:hypothetical protein
MLIFVLPIESRETLPLDFALLRSIPWMQKKILCTWNCGFCASDNGICWLKRGKIPYHPREEPGEWPVLLPENQCDLIKRRT